MNRLALAAAAVLALLGCQADSSGAPAEPLPKVGLMSSLPIYWPESTQFGDILSGETDKGWARQTIEARFTIEPLDALTAGRLGQMDRLILAQPRALSGEENVLLDTWVRDGGRLLIFADPMLTSHSQYSLGDPRRPQDVILLSPILARWGLGLEFDPEQGEGERVEPAFDGEFPVHLAGAFVLAETEEPSECIISETGILAQCRVGEGRVTALADAAVLDDGHGGDLTMRSRSLGDLISASLDF